MFIDMKKFILICLACLLSMTCHVMGQEVKANNEYGTLGHGYRAFVEIEALKNLGAINFSTTHGYQFNPNLFVGAGVDYGAVIGGFFSFVHADIRYDILTGSNHTPFMDLKLIASKEGMDILPSIGYRFKHVNIGARYWIDSGDNIMTFSLGFDFGGRKQ